MPEPKDLMAAAQSRMARQSQELLRMTRRCEELNRDKTELCHDLAKAKKRGDQLHAELTEATAKLSRLAALSLAIEDITGEPSGYLRECGCPRCELRLKLRDVLGGLEVFSGRVQ